MRRVVVLLMTVVVVATLLVAASAMAAPSSPSLDVSPKTARNLQIVKVSGSGCPSKARVHILFDGAEIARAWANGDGAFSKNVRIPRAASAGSHTLTATCDDAEVGSVEVEVVPVSLNVSPRNVWNLQIVTV